MRVKKLCIKADIGKFLLVALFTACGCAATPKSSEKHLGAQRLVESFAREGKSPGLAVSVGCNGKLLWSHGTGFADLEQRVPVSPEFTKFRVGSVAKPFTAFALARLIENNQIELDASIRNYVPTFPEKGDKISIRQLAGHLGGVRHYQGNEPYLRTRYSDVISGLEIFEDDPLVVTPRERWAYTSYGYNLLSAAMEVAAEQPFLRLMDEMVFDPIGMKGTVADDLEKVILNRGRYYRFDANGYANEPEVDNSYKWASGGFLSTTDDMVRFGLAHFDDRFLKPETVANLWTTLKTNDGQPTGYGLGWRIVKDEDGIVWFGHGGGSIGGTSQFWLFPENGLVLAAAANVTELNYGLFMVELRDYFFGLEECQKGS
ncbi:class A beta-lactamase-related serine hydrolase [Kangiella sp. HD9-110m-PIT-SAG07]|nr:class A beta-lactamase-related serine hydrolase [Kangiella sp. HD9-110m-PIT-SAG07]